MDGVGNTRAVGDVTILGRRPLEHEQMTEGCMVHQGKSLRVPVTHTHELHMSWAHSVIVT
jgi:hypothetical protein